MIQFFNVEHGKACSNSVSYILLKYYKIRTLYKVKETMISEERINITEESM